MSMARRGSGIAEAMDGTRNGSVQFWHPSRVRLVSRLLPGGRFPPALNDHRLPSGNPPGWAASRFVTSLRFVHFNGLHLLHRRRGRVYYRNVGLRKRPSLGRRSWVH